MNAIDLAHRPVLHGDRPRKDKHKKRDAVEEPHVDAAGRVEMARRRFLEGLAGLSPEELAADRADDNIQA